jgi:Glycoside hydrolase family 2 C-terminal domain 5/Glycosyl hydrolases family 2/Domain of unknown function (DUF4982)/Glycosyl hydrolases family 2, TIM barrel domain/Glycosyl hydrolases family 2, sugar binding domain
MRHPNRREFLKDMALCGISLPAIPAGLARVLHLSSPSGARHIEDLGDTPWLFSKTDPYPAAKESGFDDSGWETIGVPHCFNDLDTYQNLSLNKAFRGTVWYRKHFRVPHDQRGKRFFLEFQSVGVGAALYVNGRFKPGSLPVSQPQETTHVGSFLPFALDITDDIHYGEENVLAVRVSNAEKSFFAWPGFGTFLGLGMGFGGIDGPVYLHVTDPVYIPLNSYSPLGKWGTYIATISADVSQAEIRARTNVENTSSGPQSVELVTRLDGADGVTALTMRSTKTIAAGSSEVFEQSGTVAKPSLWYPNASEFGKPYLYRAVSSVHVNGKEVDNLETHFGIRTLSWDDDYGYVNGKKHLLKGFGQRNTYPALGSAVPAELQWNEVRLIAECGGNALRLGHFPATVETVAACDAYGVLVIQDSGDDEWALHGETARAYKRDYDRDTIIRFRNSPSVAVWESNNGIASTKKEKDIYSPATTQSLVETWDPLGGRIVESRDTSDFWPTDRKIMIGYTATYKKVAGSPSINLECYTRGNARFDYEHEKEEAGVFTKAYTSNIKDKACGWIFWMLAETMESPFLPYFNGKTYQKSLGCCAMDGNRFPKLSYLVFQNALWAPFPAQPRVALQSSWNLSGVQDVDAWSNCPTVELFLNEKSKGKRTPSEEGRCTWEGISWEGGTLKAVGMDESGNPVCTSLRHTAGAPYRILLTPGAGLTRPDGRQFFLRANGSDVALVTAMIVDKNGLWCPDADQNLHFSVEGPGQYRGSYNFYVDPSKPATYHAPGDPELQAEGGLMKVAVRSGFRPGKVTVTASSSGLLSGRASFSTVHPSTQRR